MKKEIRKNEHRDQYTKLMLKQMIIQQKDNKKIKDMVSDLKEKDKNDE